jgi:inner membrane protein
MNTTPNQKASGNGKFSSSVSFKLIIILTLSLLMLIPTIFIRNLIDEREDRRNETIREVTSKWGGDQQLFGPVIIIPYEKTELSANNRYVRYRHYLHILPDELSVIGNLDPEVRYRGIYEVITYRSELEIKGFFDSGTFNDLLSNQEKILWHEAKICFGISDLTGLDGITEFTWNKTGLTPEGGIPHTSSIASGIHSAIKIDAAAANHFHIRISLKGSESISFVPAGKSSKVKLSSAWPDPSFSGSALPHQRNISSEGFTAEWESMYLTRSFPQKWSDDEFKYEFDGAAFGVDLLIPVNIYQKSTRSVKYALLFIGLTFLVIFFIEMISKQRIHPVQYLLTGAALIIFYSLLLALSEHLNFALAYLISSISIITLIVSYANSIFSERRFVITTLIVLTALYAFLYTILQMSDFALLLGNIGLFAVIAIVMFFSRKIEWYSRE